MYFVPYMKRKKALKECIEIQAEIIVPGRLDYEALG